MLEWQPVFWHWWMLGLALLVLEVFAPGSFFLWMGVSAFIVGGALWMTPDMAWEWQALIFAVLSVASIVVWRVWSRKHQTPTDQPNLNRRGAQYVGRVFTLVEPIENGVGKIRADDTTWKVFGPDLEAGRKVKVTDLEGMILRVEAVELLEGK